MAVNGLISVIVPLFNNEKYIAEAIESVLLQNYRPVEIIVVDDGSTDKSAPIVKSFSETVSYHLQPHRGPGAARNYAVERSAGQYLAFLDADDIWMPEKLNRQMVFFEHDQKLDMVFGHAEEFYSHECAEDLRRKGICAQAAMPGYIPSTMLIKKESFFKVGRFSSDIRLGDWFEWYCRAKEQGLKQVMLPQVVAQRRLHLTNLGMRRRDARGDYARILKRLVDRKRQENFQEGPRL